MAKQKSNKKSNKKSRSKSLVLVKPSELQLSPEGLISQAIRKGATVDTLERLLAMRTQLKAEKAEEVYHSTMAEFQGECPIIKKTKKVLNKQEKGGGVRYSFAPLDSIVEQVKPLLQKYGFSYTVDTIVEDKWVTAICKVIHKFGHSETSSFKIPMDPEAFMTQAQKFASALTFAKRYAFCNAFGILTGDDDNDNRMSKKEMESAEKLQQALAMIKNLRTPAQVDEVQGKVDKSKIYSEDQKGVLIEALMVRAREIELKK